MRFFFTATALLALVACASNEPVHPAAAPAASAAVVADADKVVCHRVQDPGALVTHNVCEKQSEMDLRAQDAMQQAARANQASHMHPVPTGPGG